MSLNTIHWTNYPANSLCADAALRDDWNRLNALRGGLPILDSIAVTSALATLGDGRERMLVAHVEGHVVAMFMLQAEGALQWCTFQPSQLPLGSWVADPGFTLQTLARSLLHGPLGCALAVSITQVDPNVAMRFADDQDSRHQDYVDTAWINVEGSFASYWNERGKNLRQNMRKQRTKLQADGVRLSMQVLRDPSDMGPAIARYGVMESAGWKANQGTAIHPDNAQGRFYRKLLEDASAKGHGFVYQYQFDDKVVAMNICLLGGGTLVVLKTTYDESTHPYSPAFLLRESELQSIFEQGQIRRIEYFGRLMDWHTKMTPNKRMLYHLTMYRWPWLKRLAEARRTRRSPSERADTGQADDVGTTGKLPGAKAPP